MLDQLRWNRRTLWRGERVGLFVLLEPDAGCGEAGPACVLATAAGKRSKRDRVVRMRKDGDGVALRRGSVYSAYSACVAMLSRRGGGAGRNATKWSPHAERSAFKDQSGGNSPKFRFEPPPQPQILHSYKLLANVRCKRPREAGLGWASGGPPCGARAGFATEPGWGEPAWEAALRALDRSGCI